MDKFGYCDKPDRDVPKLKCGYPIPCPYHTIIIELNDESFKQSKPAKRTTKKRKR